MEKLEKLGKVEYLVVHHTSRDIDSASFVRSRHKYIRGWGDTGYHHLIGNGKLLSRDGKLYSGRDENLMGAHVYGHNRNSLGVCLIGDLDKSLPTEKQMNTLVDYLEEKMDKYNIPVENIFGHREFPNVTKTCPGKYLDMDLVRDLLR